MMSLGEGRIIRRILPNVPTGSTDPLADGLSAVVAVRSNGMDRRILVFMVVALRIGAIMSGAINVLLAPASTSLCGPSSTGNFGLEVTGCAASA